MGNVLPKDFGNKLFTHIHKHFKQNLNLYFISLKYYHAFKIKWIKKKSFFISLKEHISMQINSIFYKLNESIKTKFKTIRKIQNINLAYSTQNNDAQTWLISTSYVNSRTRLVVEPRKHNYTQHPLWNKLVCNLFSVFII